jgi:hypothetical protein
VTTQPAVRYTPQEWGDLVKTVAAAGGIVGGLYALVAKWWKRRQERKRLRDIEAKSIRYLLDAMRHSLHVMAPGPDRFLELGEIERQKALIDQVRDELWCADGHAGEREAQRRAEEIARVLTRTQAIQAKRDAQAEAKAAGTVPMFKEHDQ